MDEHGRFIFNETDPLVWDSDGDGLPDGNVTIGGRVVGEDLNLNGIRDQDLATGNWTETDPLASDSDVDGVSDGAEYNGSWCNATDDPNGGCGTGIHAGRILNATNPDTDGDGLRDGQEIAGWRVLVWREGTMEVMANYTVTSNPLVQDSEGDGSSDFVEFQNGSDPWRSDTDGEVPGRRYPSANRSALSTLSARRRTRPTGPRAARLEPR